MEDWNGIARLIGFADEKSMLQSFYLTEELPIADIARKLSCGPATVANRLRRHQIETRTRGGANNTHKLARLLFRMDQRYVFGTSDVLLASLIGSHQSTVYKYKRSVTAQWRSL